MAKRFHQADDDEIEQLLLNKDALNTKKSTAAAVKCFRQFLLESGRESINFEEYELSELDTALKAFYAGARKKDGSLFRKSALQNIKYGIKRYLTEKKSIDINKDTDFSRSNMVFQAVSVDLKRKGLAKIDHYPDISEEDLKKLYSRDSPVFDIDTPCGLQQKVWFEVMLFLCRRGQENLRSMTKDTFQVKKDASGLRYVYQHKDEMDKNHGVNTDPSNSVTEGRMYEMRGDPQCSVTSFEKYISKLCPERNDLWQRPKKSFTQGDTVWYCNAPLGKNSLANLMSGISTIVKLSTVYTNHSVRATSITVMDDGGVNGRHIMKVSGHRSEPSLKSYSNRVSDRKKREISNILSKAISTEKPNKENPISCTSTKPTEEQPIPPEELMEIFRNDIELEEVDENLMSDPQLNNIMLGLSTDNSSVNDNPITVETQGNNVNLQVNRTCNNLNQIEKCGSSGCFSFVPRFDRCSVNITNQVT